MAKKPKPWPKGWPKWQPSGWDPLHDDLIEPVSKIQVKNNAKKNIYVSVDKTGGFGDDDWFRVAPGEKERWRRLYHRHVRVRIRYGSLRGPIVEDFTIYTNQHSYTRPFNLDEDGG